MAAEEGNVSASEFHNEIAEELFAQVLGLLERKDRNCAEDDRMIHAAHASRFHYEMAGTVVNRALGEWQCARAHTALRLADSAIYYAWKYLEMVETYELGTFHLAYAQCTLARAFALRDAEEAARHLARARELAKEVEEPEALAVLEREFAELGAEVGKEEVSTNVTNEGASKGDVLGKAG